MDNNGIIKRSKDARKEYGQAKENEQANLNRISDWIDKQTNEDEEKTKPIKVAVNEKASSNGTINGEEGNSNNPTIPEGYTPIDTETSEWGDGSSAPTQDSVDHGLVIRDDSNNEWVWIPVNADTLMNMYEISSNSNGESLMTKTGETPEYTRKYSKSINIGNGGNSVERIRTTPGDITGAREPDLVTKWIDNNEEEEQENDAADAIEGFYRDILGFESSKDMANSFVKEYNAMLESLKMYEGFYIGRYELSSAGVKKDQPTLIGKNWYELYQKCKLLNVNDKVLTRMIWGVQWDVTCNFIANKGEKKSVIDSRSWGNYGTSITPANTGNYEKNGMYAIRKNTGSNENWKANNIYDLAGNCYECTQEATGSCYRVLRGGFCFNAYYECPAYDSFNDNTTLRCYVDCTRYSSNFNNKIGEINLSEKSQKGLNT